MTADPETPQTAADKPTLAEIVGRLPEYLRGYEDGRAARDAEVLAAVEALRSEWYSDDWASTVNYQAGIDRVLAILDADTPS